MFLGHYGLALAAKRLSPKTSLGTTVLAAELADEIWPFLLLAGVEQVKVIPGLLAASSFDFIRYPISHSLLTGILGGLAFGLVYYLLRRNLRGAVVAGVLVPSHWALDYIVHRPDLPLWPGGPRVGLGLWHSLPWTLLAELLFFGGGLAVYLWTTKAKGWVGHIALRSVVVFLVIVYLSSLFGSQDPNMSTKQVADEALLLWLLVPWAHWIDRYRMVRN
jgi:hypothetical protein